MGRRHYIIGAPSEKKNVNQVTNRHALHDHQPLFIFSIERCSFVTRENAFRILTSDTLINIYENYLTYHRNEGHPGISHIQCFWQYLQQS